MTNTPDETPDDRKKGGSTLNRGQFLTILLGAAGSTFLPGDNTTRPPSSAELKAIVDASVLRLFGPNLIDSSLDPDQKLVKTRDRLLARMPTRVPGAKIPIKPIVHVTDKFDTDYLAAYTPVGLNGKVIQDSVHIVVSKYTLQHMPLEVLEATMAHEIGHIALAYNPSLAESLSPQNHVSIRKELEMLGINSINRYDPLIQGYFGELRADLFAAKLTSPDQMIEAMNYLHQRSENEATEYEDSYRKNSMDKRLVEMMETMMRDVGYKGSFDSRKKIHLTREQHKAFKAALAQQIDKFSSMDEVNNALLVRDIKALVEKETGSSIEVQGQSPIHPTHERRIEALEMEKANAVRSSAAQKYVQDPSQTVSR